MYIPRPMGSKTWKASLAAGPLQVSQIGHSKKVWRHSEIKISTAGFNLGFQKSFFSLPSTPKKPFGQGRQLFRLHGYYYLEACFVFRVGCSLGSPRYFSACMPGVYWMCLIAAVGGEGGSCAPNDGNSWRELSCHWHAVSMPINKLRWSEATI